jgi:heme-degrading monooxygenase HmoA
MTTTGRPVRAVLVFGVAGHDAKAFETAWSELATWAAGQPGCLRQTLCCRANGGDRTYTITSDWRDAETFAAFERSDEQERATAAIRKLRRSAHMEIHEIVEHR